MQAPRTPEANDSTQFDRTCVIILGLCVVFAMFPVCSSEFITMDDPQTIAANPNLNPPTFAGLWDHWTRPHESLYVPVTYTFWWVLAWAARTNLPDRTGILLNPWIYHSANLCIHVISTILIFFLLKRLVRQQLPAFLGALLFGVHPVQVEAVAWASGTKDILCGALSLAAILLYLQSLEEGKRRFAWASMLLLLAFLAKPTALVVPLIVGMIHWQVLGASPATVGRKLWPWLVAMIPAIILTRLAQPTIHAQISPLWARPFVAADAVAWYLGKIALPINLAIDYGRTPAWIIENNQIYYTWLFSLAVVIVLLIFRRWMLLTCLLLLVIPIGPVLGLVTFTFQSYSTVADHYLYLAMLGPALAAATLCRFRWINWATGAACLVMMVMSFLQAQTWKSTESAFKQVLEVNPRSFLAHTSLANDAIARGEGDIARTHLDKAIELNPDYAFAHLSLAMMLVRKGDRDAARHHFQEVLRIYESQRNFDPAIGEQVRMMLERLK